MLQALDASLDPRRLADRLVTSVARCLPAAGWAVFGRCESKRPCVLAARGLPPGAGPTIRAIGTRVWRRRGLDVDVTPGGRGPDAGRGVPAVVPLTAHGRLVAALIGVGRRRSSLPAATVTALAARLAPAAVALDAACRLRRAETALLTDDLTGLYNGRYLRTALRHEVQRASRTGHPLSLLFIDLDRFKRFNERHGHVVGSRLLAEVAAVIRGAVRRTDVVVRFGGDEFVILLPATGRRSGGVVAGRVGRRVADGRFLRREGGASPVTASVGVATLPDYAMSGDELLRAADRAMYRAKAAGANRVCVAGGRTSTFTGPLT